MGAIRQIGGPLATPSDPAPRILRAHTPSAPHALPSMFQARHLVPSALLLGTAALLSACGGGSGGGGDSFTLLLAHSPFENGDPAPARMILLRAPEDLEAGEWEAEVVRDTDGSPVYHKAAYFEPVEGDPGILTISADPAQILIWRRNSEALESESLWTGEVGRDFHRLRDMEIADVNGDGVEDIFVVTHDLGMSYVFEQKDGGLVPTIVQAAQGEDEERIFVHEAEVGDVDGDGINEFFATPSEPNKQSGDGHQTGQIVRWDWEDGEYKQSVVENLTERHAKEILCCDYYGDGQSVLFASLEGEDAAIGSAGQESKGKPSQIKMYSWRDGEMTSEIIADLPGNLCRFLVMGDTNGDGVKEIVAATWKNGIHVIWEEDGEWKTRSAVSAYKSKSFEHAIILHDLDGDGADEMFVASDDSNLVQRFYWDPKRERYKGQKLYVVEGESLFTWNIMPMTKDL